MTREMILETLRAEKSALSQFGVKRLAVFGSVARGEMRAGSDVDILVDFEPEAHVGLFQFARLQRHLSRVLGMKVDLVTVEALRPEMRERILNEKVDAA
ncbi:MAG: nucleotidyltransferase family protein [Acidobacteriota bacterium]